jgi:hypothetical protein
LKRNKGSNNKDHVPVHSSDLVSKIKINPWCGVGRCDRWQRGMIKESIDFTNEGFKIVKLPLSRGSWWR